MFVCDCFVHNMVYICMHEYVCIPMHMAYIILHKMYILSFILPLLSSLLLLLLLYRCCFHYTLYKMVFFFYFKYEMKEFLCCNCYLLPSFITLLLTIWVRTHTHTRIAFIIFISLHIRN